MCVPGDINGPLVAYCSSATYTFNNVDFIRNRMTPPFQQQLRRNYPFMPQGLASQPGIPGYINQPLIQLLSNQRSEAMPVNQ